MRWDVGVPRVRTVRTRCAFLQHTGLFRLPRAFSRSISVTRPPVCVIYTFWLYLLSSRTANDPEWSKGHTKLVVGPIFYCTLLAGSSIISRTIGPSNNLAAHKRIHAITVLYDEGGGAVCVMMIRCFCTYCTVRSTPKYVLVVGGTGTVEKHDVICDDVSISGWQTEDSIAVATIKVPEQIGLFTNVYPIIRLFVLVFFIGICLVVAMAIL
jgi:hypothetical protein